MKKIILLIIFLIGFTVSVEGSNTITATKAGFKMMVNGAEYIPKTPLVIIDGRTYIPLRETASVLGVDINWSESTKTIFVGRDPNSSVTSKGISFSKFNINKDGSGCFKLICETQNTNKDTKTFTFTITFLREGGKIIGTGKGFVNAIESNETRTTEALSYDLYEDYKAYRIQVDSIN